MCADAAPASARRRLETGVSETDTLSDVDRISMFAEKSARSGWGQNSTWRHHQGATGPNLGRRTGAPSCDSLSWSAASRSSRSANTTRMRSVFQDPEVGMRAARLQSCAFLRSSCTCATINIRHTTRPACRPSEHQAERTSRGAAAPTTLTNRLPRHLGVLQAGHFGLVVIGEDFRVAAPIYHGV